jgi:RHS repeat-associated protein
MRQWGPCLEFLTRWALMADWGDSLSLTLDKLGRAPSLKAAGPTGTPVQLATRSWNQSGALTSLDHQVNVFSSPTWSPLTFDRLDAIDSVGGALVWFWLRQDGATAVADTLRDSVTYDGWNRVQRWKEWSSAGGGAAVTRDYTFDPTGNLFGGGGLLYDSTTGRLKKEAGGGLLTYDRAGNLTAKLGAGVTYGYDALERLVSVRQGGVLIVRYGYDVAGRRIAKRVYSGATGGTVGYLRMVYAGNQVAFETDSNNTGLATIYTWGPGVDHLVAMTVGTTPYTVVTDALGSVRALVRRQDGSWAGRLRYDPYGQLIDSAGPQPTLRYRWTGREWDAETGFYFHRSRYYDPGVGRFVQEDPIGYAGGGNLYAYVNGDVLQARDPDGLTKDATWAYLGWNAMCLGVDICFGDGGEVPLLTGGATYGQRQANALMAWAASSSIRYDAWVIIRSGSITTTSEGMEEVLYDCAKNLACAQAIVTIVLEVRISVTINWGDPRSIDVKARFGATEVTFWEATGVLISARILIDKADIQKENRVMGEVITHEFGHVIDQYYTNAVIYRSLGRTKQENYTSWWNDYYTACAAAAPSCQYGYR